MMMPTPARADRPGVAVSAIRAARRILPLLRTSNFDPSTEDGRADERMRRVALAAAASALAKLISVATALISVPLTLHYLGAERYGIWITISTFTTILTFADLGIGNGLLTAVANARGRDDMAEIRTYVSSALAVLTAIGTAIIAATMLLYRYIEWPALFNVNGALARSEAGPAMFIFLVCFALSLPATIIQRLQLGLQLGFMASLWQCASSVAALIGVLVAIWLQAGLPWLVLTFSGIPVLVLLLNSVVFYAKVMPAAAPRVAAASRRHGFEIARIGVLFLILQIATAVAYSSDNIVIAQMLGASAVAEFAVPDRLFAQVSLIVGFVVMPLWPAFGEALSRGDRAWARRTLIRGTGLAALASFVVSAALVFAGPTILYYWVGNVVQPSFLLLLGLGVWRTIEATAGPSSMYLNGLRAVRFQVVMATVTAAVALGLKVLLLERFGVEIIPWITILSFLVFGALPMVIFLRARV